VSPDKLANRLDLARWLVDARNPLVARVTVNHWWAEIFGAGLVRTAEDFGTQGQAPTHPSLLDWLAVELRHDGWSMKRTLRRIVTSATYCQTSRLRGDLLERDFANRLLARGPRFRLAAESLRDHALAVSGLLSDKMHGAPVFPPQPPNLWRQIGRNEPKYVVSRSEDRFRRGVYVVWRRAAPYPSFVNFDAPDRASCVVRRSRTNTPLQALTLMNDEAYVEAAKALAYRLMTDGPPTASIRDRVVHGFLLCTSRHPREAEISHLAEVYTSQVARFLANPAAARAVRGTFRCSADSRADTTVRHWASWFFVASILLNLDETITKG
jgi:hypothetical protein